MTIDSYGPGECTDMAKATINCEDIDCSGLFHDWSWLVPTSHTPLMVGHFGDTVFAAPDGSLSLLSTLDGEYERIARTGAEFNRLKGDPENVDSWFQWGWANIALQSGIVPKDDECLGWKIAPILGGQFGVDEIMTFPRRAYLSIQGQLHRQIRGQ
ncbi:DUF1851 domain-containing protein [Mesorhizobium sp. M0663]|uniref:T6SS immunity protein Tdi1 domain-containing protein n=1 Tax=unclassified Mesorhizobium TaxID=325217 RepID=UPI0033395DAE